MRLYCSFLSARLRYARSIGSFLLALLYHSAVRSLALPLPFARAVAGNAALPLLAHNLAVALEFPFLTLRVRMELLAEAMLALLTHALPIGLSRYCKAHANSNNKTKIGYFHSLRFSHFPYSNRAGVMVRMYVQLKRRSLLAHGGCVLLEACRNVCTATSKMQTRQVLVAVRLLKMRRAYLQIRL